MTAPRLAVLTPAGTGAIATLALRGDGAWPLIRARFRPASGTPLPEAPGRPAHWFGTLGEGAGDEVVVALVAVEPEVRVEIHGHGGPRVVRWLERQLLAAGAESEDAWASLAADLPELDPRAAEPLAHAPTARTAGVLLDQLHGAFRDDCRRRIDAPAGVAALARFAPLGRHLVRPWRVVVAGAPNAGKSTLVNALVGYQRSVVSPEAGTTRDVVRAPAALGGWPVELLDTAGLRDTDEALEAAGVERARAAVAAGDLVVWVADGGDSGASFPPPGLDVLLVANKCDRPAAWDRPTALHVSAVRGEGVESLIAAIVARLVPEPPADGAAVPFTAELADWVESAAAAQAAGDDAGAVRWLRRCAGIDAP